PQNADVRAEEFVGRTSKKIAVPIPYIDQRVRRMVHGIDEYQCSGGVHGLSDGLDWIARADGIGGRTDGDELGPRTELAFEVIEVERAIFRMNIDVANRRAAVLGRADPRRYVGVVIEPGHDDLVARLPARGNGPAEGEGQRRHVRAKDYRVGVGRVEQV